MPDTISVPKVAPGTTVYLQVLPMRDGVIDSDVSISWGAPSQGPLVVKSGAAGPSFEYVDPDTGRMTTCPGGFRATVQTPTDAPGEAIVTAKSMGFAVAEYNIVWGEGGTTTAPSLNPSWSLDPFETP